MKATALVLAALVLGLSTACTKKADSPGEVIQEVACGFEGIAVMSLSSSISSYAQCANPPAITAMVTKWAKDMSLCDKADKAKKRKKEKEVQEALIEGVSKNVSEASGAKNLAAVKASVKEEMGIKGAVGDVVCSPLLETLSFTLLMQLPVEAQCAGPVDMEKVKADLLAKCLAAI